VGNGDLAAAERGPNVISLSAELLRQGRVIPTAAQIAFTGEDQLVVTTFSSTTGSLAVRGRFLDAASGKIIPFFQSTSVPAFIQNTLVVVPGIGYLLGLNLGQSFSGGNGLGAPPFLQVAIARGSTINNVTTETFIAQGYGGIFTSLSWPGQNMVLAGDGAGWTNWHTGTAPAAGVEILETVPAFTEWRPKLLRFNLTTSAAAGNRTILLKWTQAVTGRFVAVATQFNQTPSTTVGYHWFIGALPIVGAFGSIVNAPLPDQLRLIDSDSFSTLTTGLDAADQYTAPQYETVEFRNIT